MRIETVTRVINYNTFRTKSRQHSVILANVSTNCSSIHKDKATKQLRLMIGGKKIGITTISRDCYGRCIARVTLKGKSVNLMINKWLETK